MLTAQEHKADREIVLHAAPEHKADHEIVQTAQEHKADREIVLEPPKHKADRETAEDSGIGMPKNERGNNHGVRSIHLPRLPSRVPLFVPVCVVDRAQPSPGLCSG